MKNLNTFELVSIKYGIKAEMEQGFRIHSAMENETFNLFMEYTDMITNPDRYKDYEIEVTTAALHKLADFWTNYYLHGPEEAMEIYKGEAEVY